MIDIKDIETKKLLESASGILEQTRPFTELMMRYKCAMLEVKTKLDVLNTQLSLENDRNPFESISCRLKTVPSIIEKLNRKGFELSAASIEKNLNDVAGIRVICSFPDDIYVLADKLCSQDDIRLIEKKDYIKNPKPNGYRSLHLIVEIPIFLDFPIPSLCLFIIVILGFLLYSLRIFLVLSVLPSLITIISILSNV